MRITKLVWLLVAIFGNSAALAADGLTIAGPIGGSDMRSAQLPPPGLYGGGAVFYGEGHQFFDGNGNLVPALDALALSSQQAGMFLLYVPDLEFLGGRIGIAGTMKAGRQCGHLFAATPSQCETGLGDSYAEISWSRHFGTMRPSRYADARPIAEGLTLSFGLGTVIPVGQYSSATAAAGLAIGNNTWDIAPSAGFTYVTAPIIADGTEFSAKIYWNHYLENPANQYRSGSIVDLDFAVTEKIGKFQLGLAGYFLSQTSDDEANGIKVAPDGRRVEVLALGGVIAYDMPEYGMVVKLKALAPVEYQNAIKPYGIGITWAKKL